MTRRGSILLVDDEEKILKTLGRVLRDDGHEVVEARRAREARDLLACRTFDLLLVDNLMPEMTGLELIREIASATSDGERPQIVMMTAHASVESAVEAMKLGALDYLQKPFEIDELLVVVRRALEHEQLRTENRYLLAEREEEFNHYGIVGRSRVMQDVIAKAEMVAESRSTVLLTGETGTGKELVARAIHDRSAQRARPLIKVNCAAIPESLLESELFGHVRGAFTDASRDRRGKFSLANRGTILLDEIGTLGRNLQAKLLRVLQEREFEPVGADRVERVDVRVIAATNRDLHRLVEEGRFQEDLYYRLQVVPIVVPPLRERIDDVPLLARHFVDKHAARNRWPVPSIEQDAIHALLEHDWPGNVRELENTIERALVLSAGRAITRSAIVIDAVAAVGVCHVPFLHMRDNVQWAERETIRQALRACPKKRQAAVRMGISPRALSYYLAKHPALRVDRDITANEPAVDLPRRSR